MVEPVNRKDKPGGGKIYLHPLTEERFDSVTTVLDIMDKAALKQWAANLSTDWMIDNLPAFAATMIEPVCGNTFNRCAEKHGRENKCERCPCWKCQNCLTRLAKSRHHAESSRRSQEGTETHEAIDHWVLTGGDRLKLRPEVQPYFDTFLQFVKDYGLKPEHWQATEMTVLNREHMFAGTSDGIIELGPWTPEGRDKLAALGLGEARIRVDYKTREKAADPSKPNDGLYNDMPLQGKAYDMCPVVLLPNGEEHEAPTTDACAILQLRPNLEYSFKLMVSNDGTWQAFLGVLAAYRWMNTEAKLAFKEDPVLLAQDRPRAVVTVFRDLMGAAVIDVQLPEPAPVPPVPDIDPWAAAPGIDPWEPVIEPTATPVEDDPWAVSTPAAGHAPPLAPPVKKTAAKKAAPKKAAAPAESKPAVPVVNATMDNIRNFKPGSAVTSAYNDEIPF